MPEEERSQNVTGQPNDQSPTQPPRQLPTNQQPPTTNTEDASNDDPDNSKTLQNDIRKGEYWLVGIGLATILVNIGIWHTYIGQLSQMTRATKATEQAAYAACVATQISRETLIQGQREESISHAATVATIEQAAAGIEAERAIVVLTFRFPHLEELFNNQLNIPFSVKNVGKSEGRDVHSRAKAILLDEKQILRMNDKHLEKLEMIFIGAGEEFPDKPIDRMPVTVTIPVRDDKSGKIISASSQEAKEFLGGNKTVVVYGHMQYSDFSGIHKVRFCQRVFIVNAGTTREPVKNDEVCAKYNQQDDQYNGIPKINSFAPIDNQIKAIDCVKPQE